MDRQRRKILELGLAGMGIIGGAIACSPIAFLDRKNEPNNTPKKIVIPPMLLNEASRVSYVSVINAIFDTAGSEYTAAIANNKIKEIIEYQDSRGFTLYVEQLSKSSAYSSPLAPEKPVQLQRSPRFKIKIKARPKRLNSSYCFLEPQKPMITSK
jgi:hypothetical protein